MSDPSLDRDAQRLLLRVARDTIGALLTEGQVPRLDLFGCVDPGVDHPVRAERGAFVTIHRQDELRGCIGFLEARAPLCESVAELAVAAATRDSRFKPVQRSELSDLQIEISVMSPLTPVSELEQVIIGRDGLVLQCQGVRGVLLPQVAVQHGWSRAVFLAQVCRKAGLPGDVWPCEGDLFRFGADVFNERELGQGGGLDPLGRLPLEGT